MLMNIRNCSIKKYIYHNKYIKENHSEFYTAKGERVRSKSELLISEQLCKYGIPYRYEKPIELMDWNRVIVCRPDFTVMNRRTGKIYLLGKNLIITRETVASPLNIQKVDSYINEFLL